MNLVSAFTPPVVGAFIGWITNYIAIRMLFRPLRPWRVLGIRVPMTPGVIPGKRHDLAINIGKMVGSQLLTSADISKALSEEAFKQELTGMVNARVSDILHRELGPLPTVVPKRFRTSFEAGVNILRWRTVKLIHGYLDSQEFSAGLGATITSHIEAFLSRPLGSWFTDRHRDHLFASIVSTVETIMKSPQAEEWLGRYLDQRLARIVDEENTLNDLLPEEFTGIVVSLVEREIPGLLEKAAQYAGEPEMRSRMSKGICTAIHSFIDSLGPMAALVSGFVSPELIETKINEYLADKGGDIADWLNNDHTTLKARAIAAEKISAFMSRPLKEILAGLSPDTVDEVKKAVCREVLSVIKSPATIANLTTLLRDAMATQNDRPVNAILTDLFGKEGLEGGAQWTKDEILAALRSSKSKRILDEMFSSLVDTYILRQPLGALAKLLPKEVRHGISDYVVQQSHALLLEEVPRLVDFVNIQRIVTRKVDSLDLLRLERLLLGIMEEQFKYINLFGALLGFIIGLANLVLLRGLP